MFKHLYSNCHISDLFLRVSRLYSVIPVIGYHNMSTVAV